MTKRGGSTVAALQAHVARRACRIHAKLFSKYDRGPRPTSRAQHIHPRFLASIHRTRFDRGCKPTSHAHPRKIRPCGRRPTSRAQHIHPSIHPPNAVRPWLQAHVTRASTPRSTTVAPGPRRARNTSILASIHRTRFDRGSKPTSHALLSRVARPSSLARCPPGGKGGSPLCGNESGAGLPAVVQRLKDISRGTGLACRADGS